MGSGDGGEGFENEVVVVGSIVPEGCAHGDGVDC